jgi:hypothetical protein
VEAVAFKRCIDELRHDPQAMLTLINGRGCARHHVCSTQRRENGVQAAEVGEMVMRQARESGWRLPVSSTACA